MAGATANRQTGRKFRKIKPAWAYGLKRTLELLAERILLFEKL
jgi:hypothetical protein